VPRRELSPFEVQAAYNEAQRKRSLLLAKIVGIKKQKGYNHETVRLLLQVARRLTTARAKLLDNWYKAWYVEHDYPVSQQEHFIARAEGRVK
jgi:hypothetical protein